MNLLETLPHINRLYVLNGFLLGPLMWLYIRSSTEKNFTFTTGLLFHFIPFLMDFAFQIPMLALSGAEKMKLYFDMVNRGNLNGYPILYISKSIHSLIYFLLGVRLIYLYKKNVTNTASYIDMGLHRWLLLFCCILLLPLTTIIIIALSGFAYFPISFLAVAVFMFINAVYFAIFLKPNLFNALPHQIVTQSTEETAKQKYEYSNLKDAQKEKLVEKLVAHVEAEKSYQEPELTIADLAEQVNIQPHYLSQIINQNLNCTFLDFINGYRIEAAKKMLRSDDYGHFTILAIAYEAGFNSKTAFYNAFKKRTGTTPSSYRKLEAAA